MNRRALPPPAADRRQGVRGALLHTLPGRAIVVGLGVKLAVFFVGLALGGVPQFFAAVDTVAGVVAACGIAYFTFLLIVLAKRRLLWRVRRKLYLSYVFIGLIPALLLVAFSLLCGFLLFYSFSSYLVQSRLRALGDQARFLAQSTALEIQRAGGRDVAGILARRQAAAAADYPSASMAVVPVNRICGQPTSDANPKSQTGDVRLQMSGPWTHVDPPKTVPAWIGCPGFAGVLAYSHRSMAAGSDVDTHLLVRSVAFPDGPRLSYAVVVDLLVNDAIRQQLREETGVELRTVTAAAPLNDQEARPLPGRDGAEEIVGTSGAASGLLNNLKSFMDYRDWSTGASGPVTLTSALSVAELYDRISATEGIVGRRLGQGLLVVLFAIGALFLIIEAMALLAGLALAKSLTGSVHALFAGTERVRQGDFTHKIAVRSEDQLGELALSFNQMTASIEDLLRRAADRAALAINARLYERQRGLTEEIQRSVFPSPLPRFPGVALAARYNPAADAALGGDWYDAFMLPGGALGLAIGDVVGRGFKAAALMSQLRSALRAYALDGASPLALLTKLNVVLRQIEKGGSATLLYLVFDPASGEVTLSSAGHPPPLLMDGSGDARYLELPPSVPLGVSANAVYDMLTAEVEPPGRLLLYTDGLMERAGESLQDGLERLRGSVPNEAKPADELCDLVLQALLPEGAAHDDSALLVMSTDPLGDPLVVTLPAEPDSPPLLRRILRRWLADRGAGSQETDELILACAEASANAIEHAYPPEPHPFQVEGRYEDGKVTLTVRDWGRWRPPRGEYRGRGLMLMEGLADSVHVEPSDEGTTVTLSRRLLEAQRA